MMRTGPGTEPPPSVRLTGAGLYSRGGPEGMAEFLRPLPPRFVPPPVRPLSFRKDEEDPFSYRAYPYPYPYPYIFPLIRPVEPPYPYNSPPQSPLVRKPPPPPLPPVSTPAAVPPSRPVVKEQRKVKRSRAGPLRGFARGSLIRLATGELKRVEDMRTEDFISSAESSSVLRLDPSTVVRIESSTEASAILTLSYGQDRSQVEVECTMEHPYFVYGQGWASCRPERTLAAYGLKVHQLQVGDVCISLSPRPPTAPPSAPTHDSRKRRWSAPDDIHDQPVPRVDN